MLTDAISKSTTQYRLCAQHREKIPGCLRDVRPAHHPHSVQIHIVLFKQRRIGQTRTLLPPIVKFLRAIVWRNELM